MTQTEAEFVSELSKRIAEALEATELRAGSNAFVLSGPITLLRPEISGTSSVEQPPKIEGTFKGFYAT